MTRETAYQVLGIPAEEVSPSLVRERYIRLSRRYPASEFPEKAIEIRQAYDLLGESTSPLERILTEETFSIGDFGVSIPELRDLYEGGFKECLRIVLNAASAIDEDPVAAALGGQSEMAARIEELLEDMIAGLSKGRINF